MIPSISAPTALPIAIPTIPPVDTDGSSSLSDALLEELVVEVMNGAAFVVLVDSMAAVILLPKHPSDAHGFVKQQPMKAIGVNLQVYHKPVETHACGSMLS